MTVKRQRGPDLRIDVHLCQTSGLSRFTCTEAWALESVSLPRRGVGLSSVTRKSCENNIKSQSQFKGCVKNLIIGFPDTPLMVIDWEAGGPVLKRQVGYVALVSKRKLVVWPSMVRITWGS